MFLKKTNDKQMPNILKVIYNLFNVNILTNGYVNTIFIQNYTLGVFLPFKLY